MDPLEWDDSEENPFTLPDWATEAQVADVTEKITKACEKIGLYVFNPPVVSADPLEDSVHLWLNFNIGNLAFVKRVQDPEQDRIDTTFHRMEADATRDQVEDIKRRFLNDGTQEGDVQP